MTDAPTGPAFNIHHIPFSSHGSWFGVSPVTSEHVRSRDLHLVSHQNGMHPVLRFVPVAGTHGERVETRWTATAGQLTWTGPDGPDGHIEMTYQSADTLRLRGTGLGLRICASADRLTPFSGTYFYQDPLDGSHVFTSYESGRRYRITVLAGRATDVRGVESLGEADRGLTVTGDGDLPWEAAVEELDTARPPYVPSDTHERAVERAARVFTEFADAVTPWRTPDTPAAELAAYVLWSATVAPAGFLQRPAVLMSKHWMDKVWSWDHCFNALALAPGAPELAWDQFRIMFDHQDESGALPDSVTHSEILHNFVKPPIHGWALRHLRGRLPRPPSRTELSEVYHRLERWTRFWLDSRRAPGQTLPHYQHGNDSGWDNATTFDPGRLRITADLSAFLILQLRELADLATELDRADEAAAWAHSAEALQAAVIRELWTGERFQARSPHTGAGTTSLSLLDLMPVVLGEHLPTGISTRLAAHIETHLTAHGPATERPDSPHYQSDGYWRGPIWAPATVLIEDGLRRAGHVDLADEISARFRALCENSGFAENFDALTGEGLRDRAYTWTASSYLLLAEAHAHRDSR
ncbi:trehalase [Streptomyces sp. 1114.5]|uniref:amylo-alpha-1,6-glucosidase n=1 Tax=Streptomyces sp. 1114.5 TaxID=1938830 RepID=UPI000EACA65C|nr:trehalase family glycosidase [Streptomyces sp. 1114.5]RKT19953.1 trehalase [Streptomyces sp. 1114.5]